MPAHDVVHAAQVAADAVERQRRLEARARRGSADRRIAAGLMNDGRRERRRVRDRNESAPEPKKLK